MPQPPKDSRSQAPDGSPLSDGNDSMLTVREVANYLHVSSATVYKWAKDKEIPSHRLGRLWRFKKSEIDKWMHQEPIYLANGGVDASPEDKPNDSHSIR
jgi:excisionase family DNA binding protein